jgi:hypothetical protein
VTFSSAPRAARSVRHEWELLCSNTDQPKAFDASMVAELPEPARRWLTHAIAPGTPLWQSVELTMRGEIRLGSWRPFTARQVLAPPRGFIWAATALVRPSRDRLRPLQLRHGSDELARGRTDPCHARQRTGHHAQRGRPSGRGDGAGANNVCRSELDSRRRH